MESANYIQDQVVGSSSDSSSSSNGIGISNMNYAWNPISTWNTNGFPYPNENLIPRDSRHQENTLVSSLYTSMAPALGFDWTNNATESAFASNNLSPQDSNLLRTTEELSHRHYLRYIEDEFKNQHKYLQSKDIETGFLHKLFSPSGNFMNKSHISQGYSYSSSFSSGVTDNERGFSQILPSVNVSSLNQMGLTKSGCLDMNLQALDLLTSSRITGSCFPSLQNQMGFLYGLDPMQESLDQMPLYSSNKISPKTKRNTRKMEPKALQTASKKLRLEERVSCSPFKVRKEKLGDRISVLQQLVAPFGKTDTASVLMEAIGYIKFLQDQVETLSVPYMKNKTRSVIIGIGDAAEDESVERKRDLKSRGLCLVPMSCLSYITDGGGGAAPMWPPSQCGGPI